MNRRSTRYIIKATFRDGRTDDCLQANSRRADAVKRAQQISADVAGWPNLARVWVHDTMPEMIDGKFIDTVFNRVVCPSIDAPIKVTPFQPFAGTDPTAQQREIARRSNEGY